MNTFAQWVDDFEIRFSGFAKIIDQSENLQTDFRDTFQPFALDVLKKATKELCLLDPAPFPGEVMGKLYTRCKSMTMLPRMHAEPHDPTGERKFKCLSCFDDGSILVYHPMGYQPIKNGVFSISKHLRTCVVACICEAGNLLATERRYKSANFERIVKAYPRFNPRKMHPVSDSLPEQQAIELTHFVLNDYKEDKFSGFEAYE